MHDVNAERFGKDELGTLLANTLNLARLAAGGIGHERSGIAEQAEALLAKHLVQVPRLRDEGATVEFLKAGAKDAWEGFVQHDTLVFRFAFTGRWDLARAAFADAGGAFPRSMDVDGAGVGLPVTVALKDDAVRVAIQRKLFFVSGDGKPDVSKARDVGKALKDAAVRIVRDAFAFAGVREAEIAACNEAIRLAVAAGVDKAQAFLDYGEEFRAGIDLPEWQPGAPEPSTGTTRHAA